MGVTAGELKLSPLQNNGGPTATHALLPGSPAINGGPDTDYPLTDQRGVPRAFNLRADIGAFELDVFPPLAMTCPVPITVDAESLAGATVTFNVPVRHADGLPFTVVWAVDGVPRQTNAVPAGGPPTSATVSFTALFPMGSHRVTFTVADGVNEPLSCATSVAVRNRIGDTLYVTSTADSGFGSLRDAIASAEWGNTIVCAVTGAVTLTRGELVIQQALNIMGPGADRLAIERSESPGVTNFRILNIVDGPVTLSGLTIRNGACVDDEMYGGAGLFNQHELTLRDCAIVDNSCAVSNGRGGGAHSTGISRLAAVNCLFARNSASGEYGMGGGLSADGTLALTNCTFSGNEAGFGGGGLYVYCDMQDMSIDSCTIVSNAARCSGGLFNGSASWEQSSQILLGNSIVAANSGSEDIGLNGRITSTGCNLLGFVHETLIDTLPTDHMVVTGDELKLGPLQDNGGPTATHALLPGSMALNAGPASGYPPTDQRGVPRPFGPGVDVGAFECNFAWPLSVVCDAPVWVDATALEGAAATVSASVFDADSRPVTVVWSVDGLPRQTNFVLFASPPAPVSVSFTDLFAMGHRAVMVTVSDGIHEPMSCTTAVFVRDLVSPGTLHVTSLADRGFGSLREALALAGAGNTIVFSVTGAITLTSDELVINQPLNIVGPGADRLAVERSAAPGTRHFRIFNVISSGVTLSGLAIRNGYFGTNSWYQDGAGISNQRELLLRDCAIVGNTSERPSGRGAGLCNGPGARLTALNCLFAHNVGADYSSEGGSLYNYGWAALTNCTFSGNVAGRAGAMQNDGWSSGLVLDSCTVVGNSAQEASAIYNPGNDPYWFGWAFLRNTIVAGNLGAEDIRNHGYFLSGGFNLFGGVHRDTLFFNTLISSHFTDLLGVTAADLKLGPLQNNGGPTPTHAPLPGSPALNAGTDTGYPPTDQRGVPRPCGGRVDIGAFESDAIPPLVVTCPAPLTLDGASPEGATATLIATVADADGDPLVVVWTVDGVPRKTNAVPAAGPPTTASVSFTALFGLGIHDVTVSVADGHGAPATCCTAVNVRDLISPGTLHVNSPGDWGHGTLREAISIAESNSTIVFSVTGAVTLTRGQLHIGRPLSIVGPGAHLLSVERSAAPDTPDFRIFCINSGWYGPRVTISGLSIRNGRLTGTNGSYFGAGVFNSGDLTLRDCAIMDNLTLGVDTRGAGVGTWGGILKLVNCTLAHNVAAGEYNRGGAIYNNAEMHMTNCTLSDNVVIGGGGALYNDAWSGRVFLLSCTIVSNWASYGGGIYNDGWFQRPFAYASILNSIVAANAADDPDGADIDNHGDVESQGHNLFGIVPRCQPSSGDQFGVTPDQLALGPLQNNGGPTPTHALLPGSIALDAGDDGLCLPADQRGVSRPRFAHCDIGAYEAASFPPTITCPSPASVDCASTAVTLTTTVQDVDGDALSVLWLVDGEIWQSDSVPASGPPTLQAVSFTATFAPGIHTVTVQVSDGVFPQVACATTVTVRDTVPPIITCPTNLTVATDRGRCSAGVNYLLPTASDNCALASLACQPPPGATFAKGTTTVTCTVTDASDNQARCTFTVTVQDREAPKLLILVATPSVLWPANHQMVRVTLRAIAADNCGPVTSRIKSVTSSDPDRGAGPGDKGPDWKITGPMTLTLRAEHSDRLKPRIYSITVECRDPSGNTATRRVTVTVPARKR